VTFRELYLIYGAAIGCAVLCSSMSLFFYGTLDHEIDPDHFRTDSYSRFIRVSTESVGMMFAWLTVFGTHLIAAYFELHEGLQVRLFTALGQSLACFLVVLVLDAITDLECSGPHVDKAVIMIIFALGTSVGLTWEHAFEKCAEVAVEFMAEEEDIPLFRYSNDPKVWALGLSICILIVILPAYRWFIVPRMYQMIEHHDKELKMHEEVYRQTEYQRRQTEAPPGAGGAGEMFGINDGVYVWQGNSQIEMASTAGPSRENTYWQRENTLFSQDTRY